jgi:hypothetical protein
VAIRPGMADTQRCIFRTEVASLGLGLVNVSVQPREAATAISPGHVPHATRAWVGGLYLRG